MRRTPIKIVRDGGVKMYHDTGYDVHGNGPAWAQGIVVLDAAALLAETPTEGVNHGANHEPR